jgi:hypothetical protein
MKILMRNMGTTAFMETVELALELRGAGYGDNGEQLVYAALGA